MDNQGVSILVVDDEFSVRDSLYNWFKNEGYRVDTAENGMEALRKLQEGPWDIALVDIKMPGMDGMELQRHIKKIDSTIILIIITAYATVDTAVEAMKEGAYDYLSKPIDPDKLYILIRNAVNQRRLIAENIQLKQKVEELSLQNEIVGDSPQIKIIKILQSPSVPAERSPRRTHHHNIFLVHHSNAPENLYFETFDFGFLNLKSNI